MDKAAPLEHAVRAGRIDEIYEQVTEHTGSTEERSVEGTNWDSTTGKLAHLIGARIRESTTVCRTVEITENLRWNFANFLFLNHVGMLDFGSVAKMLGWGWRGGGNVRLQNGTLVRWGSHSPIGTLSRNYWAF